MDATELTKLLQGGGSPDDLKKQLLQNLIAQQQAEPKKQDDTELRQCQARLRASRRRNRSLAAALGACVCFGDPRCRQCGGEGQPGTRAPEPDAFAFYVEPVLRQLGLLVDDELVPNQEG